MLRDEDTKTKGTGTNDANSLFMKTATTGGVRQWRLRLTDHNSQSVVCMYSVTVLTILFVEFVLKKVPVMRAAHVIKAYANCFQGIMPPPPPNQLGMP